MTARKIKYDDYLAEFQNPENDLASEVSEVVPVAPANFLDQPMDTQASEQATDLAGVLMRQMLMQTLVRETTDDELAAC